MRVRGGVFALHPLHVESVAWVAERKDVLSGFFFMLTLGAYARYGKAEGRRKNAESGTPPLRLPSFFILHPSSFYILSLAFFALGLMSKPMLVTVPFVLLLLDYWPLKRIAECGLRSAECGVRSAESEGQSQAGVVSSQGSVVSSGQAMGQNY